AIVRRAAPEARVWSVVKANAYGHGIERVWSALGATDGFAMLNSGGDVAHLTQDSTFTLGRRLAGLIYADKAKSFGGYTLFAPQT
ncbi:alanine racemase, partial [Salmonella enterica subsp. enterica serovar Anatum]|nr:alanine racemase [Salmonella enterica subsp. enterica serovar Anatum]